MTTDFYNLLLTDCALAAVLLGLFHYVSRVSRGLRGITTWGVSHFVYSLGAAMLDGTSNAAAVSGADTHAALYAGVGGLLACSGMAGLAWSLIRFVRQRPLHGWEMALVPGAATAALACWLLFNTSDAQGAVMSAVEVVALAIIIWHLAALRDAPDRVPAGLMILACLGLLGLYSRDLLQALTGTYGPNPGWVNADLSLWYLLNFCMLMLTSFHAAKALRRSAQFDPLTGALNRRGLHSELAHHDWASHAGPGHAVVALDLDHFKGINDQYGHDTGDTVLQRFSEVVRDCIRGGDLFVRLGGDEFMLLLRDVEPAQARRVAEHIRRQTMELQFPGVAPPLQATVSAGIAHARRDVLALRELMRHADTALYAAKQLGRNQVEWHGVDATARPGG